MVTSWWRVARRDTRRSKAARAAAMRRTRRTSAEAPCRGRRGSALRCALPGGGPDESADCAAARREPLPAAAHEAGLGCCCSGWSRGWASVTLRERSATSTRPSATVTSRALPGSDGGLPGPVGGPLIPGGPALHPLRRTWADSFVSASEGGVRRSLGPAPSWEAEAEEPEDEDVEVMREHEAASGRRACVSAAIT
jgi:hypothetical protein